MLPAEALMRQISVEIDGLKSVAEAMRQELESSFRTQVTPIHDAMQPGASIGGPIAGASWVALQNKYSANIQATLDALFNLDLGSQAVADAAHVIARDYGDADAFSATRVTDVQQVISYTPPEPGTDAASTGAVTGE
ncbi:hypothetical protein AB0M36_37145 [Actinoplanes sp. NPDC051346]|uniref:hypothetical protein n=1 Tax=Actinoplanes sp. NPDC051346 TaxID=3155048 RepID=UPI00341C5AE5